MTWRKSWHLAFLRVEGRVGNKLIMLHAVTTNCSAIKSVLHLLDSAWTEFFNPTNALW